MRSLRLCQAQTSALSPAGLLSATRRKPSACFFQVTDVPAAGQFCQVFIQREQLINPFERLPADGIGNLVLVQSRRDCLHEVPAAMDPAECMFLAGNLLVSVVAIRLKDSMESFEEICGKAAVSARVILIDAALMIWLVLAIGEHPHVRLRGVLPFFLTEHLNRRLIRMND